MSFTAGSLAIAARVFSCVTTSTVAGNASLLPTWSKWLWVLMTVVTGRSVTDATRSRIAWPLPASLVSTSTTPRAGHEHGGVAALPGNHEQVVADLLDRSDRLELLRLLRDHRAGRRQHHQRRRQHPRVK